MLEKQFVAFCNTNNIFRQKDFQTAENKCLFFLVQKLQNLTLQNYWLYGIKYIMNVKGVKQFVMGKQAQVSHINHDKWQYITSIMKKRSP